MINSDSIISNKNKEIILREWGETRYNEAIRWIDIYTEKWQLKELALIETPARNVVLTCISPKYDSCVLKIRFDENFDTEMEVLRAFNGRGYCRLYEYSVEDKILLIEHILPGDDIYYKTTREERGSIFCDLYNKWYSLPVDSVNLSIFPTILSLLEDNKKGDIWKEAGDFISSHRENAKEIILFLNSSYPTTINHGDLSFRNILKNQSGSYTAIDPTGIVGIPPFNIAEFIIGEFGNNLTYEPIENLLIFIDLMAKNANVSIETIKKCLYIETVLRLHGLEFGDGRNIKDYDHMIDNILTAKRIMEN